MKLNPLESISLAYQSIPGKTAYNKTSFLGGKALQTLPFVAAGYLLRNRASSGMVIQCMEALPAIGQMLEKSLLSRTLLSFGIGLEIRNGISAAKMFRNASSPTDRLAFFCMAYAATHYAMSYFRSINKEPQPREFLEPTAYSPLVDCALKCVALPIQFMYRPYETIAGLSAGAFFAKVNLSPFIDKINMKQPAEKRATLNELSTSLSQFLKPSSKTSLTTKIWNECNRVILAVPSVTEALKSSLHQGKELVS